MDETLGTGSSEALTAEAAAQAAAELVTQRFPDSFAGVYIDGTTAVVLVAGDGVAEGAESILREHCLDGVEVRTVRHSSTALGELLAEVRRWAQETTGPPSISGIDVRANVVRIGYAEPHNLALARGRWNTAPVRVEGTAATPSSRG